MPQRVSDERLAKHNAGAWALLPPPGDTVSRDLGLDLLDARQQIHDANAAITKLQKELDGR